MHKERNTLINANLLNDLFSTIHIKRHKFYDTAISYDGSRLELPRATIFYYDLTFDSLFPFQKKEIHAFISHLTYLKIFRA